MESTTVLAAVEGSLVITRPWAGVLALAALAGLIGAAHLVVVTGTHPKSAEGSADNDDGNNKARDPLPAQVQAQVHKRRRGIKALVIGADGRASTSKVQAVLWTFAVFYAFIFLLVWGRSTSCGGEGLDQTPRCQAAAEARAAYSRAVSGEVQPEYYVLLGFPLAAALTAKALTSAKAADRPTAKPPIAEDQEGVVQGLSEVISNDRGETDLMDFQYFAFNLLTLAFFFMEFLTKPGGGLPDLPPTLIALSGVSTAVYTTKKALEGGLPARGDRAPA